METIDLTKYPVYQKMRVDMFTFAQSLEVETVVDQMMNQMLITLKGFVLAEERESSTHVIKYQVPVIPAILKKMFPSLIELPTETREKRVSLKRRILYPEANVRMPELGSGRVRMLVEEEECLTHSVLA